MEPSGREQRPAAGEPGPAMPGAFTYDPARVAAYFDDLAEGEWTRLERSPEAEISLAVHAHYLGRFVAAGDRVLEVGAGAGRFTIELARLGGSLVVTDLSPVQLDLNREKVVAAGLDEAVEERLLLDVVDMSVLPDASFDVVVCYGGPLSYVMDRRRDALRECIRLTRPGGHILASVMSLWGSVHKGLPFVLSTPPDANARIVASGDITPEALPGHGHYCHLFRPTELAGLLEGEGLILEAISGSTCLATGWGGRLAEIRADQARWTELLGMEIAACAEAGCVGTGPHLIAVARRPDP